MNMLATAGQQIRQEWKLLQQDPEAGTSDKAALQKRWQAIDGENLRQLDDRELLNRRRLAIGLRSLEDYEAESRQRLLPANCSKKQ